MHKSWMTKRKEIIELIKKISDVNGGDDPQWLKEYTDQVLVDWAHNYDSALTCFEEIYEQGMVRALKVI